MLFDRRFSLDDYDITDDLAAAIRSRSNAFMLGKWRVRSFQEQVYMTLRHQATPQAVLLLPPIPRIDVPAPYFNAPTFVRQDVVHAAIGEQTRRHHRHDIGPAQIMLMPDALQRAPFIMQDVNRSRNVVAAVDLPDRNRTPIVAGIDRRGATTKSGRPLPYVKAYFGKGNLISKLAVTAGLGEAVWTSCRTNDYLTRIGARHLTVQGNDLVPMSLYDLVVSCGRYCQPIKKGLDPSLSLDALLGFPVPLYRHTTRTNVYVSSPHTRAQRQHTSPCAR